VLVTGGAGFIGSNLVETLLAKGYNVTVYDNFSAKLGQLKAVQEKIRIINADMLDEDALTKATLGQDYVVHLAALKSVDESLANPVASAKGNILGFVNLLNGVLKDKEKISQKKVIFASTAAVYGYNSNFPLKETEKPEPQSPYALEKVVGEQYLELFYNLFGLQSASMRFFNVYGPRQFSKSPHCGGVTIVMNEFLKNNKKSTLLGDGSQTRDMIYVGDVVDAIMAAIMTKNKLTGGIYNICTGKRVTVKEVHEEIAQVMGIKDQVSFHQVPFADGNVVHSVGDPQKATRDFGFVSKTSLKEGIENTWAWYQQNLQFYDK